MRRSSWWERCGLVTLAGWVRWGCFVIPARTRGSASPPRRRPKPRPSPPGPALPSGAPSRYTSPSVCSILTPPAVSDRSQQGHKTRAPREREPGQAGPASARGAGRPRSRPRSIPGLNFCGAPAAAGRRVHHGRRPGRPKAAGQPAVPRGGRDEGAAPSPGEERGRWRSARARQSRSRPCSRSRPLPPPPPPHAHKAPHARRRREKAASPLAARPPARAAPGPGASWDL